jgi:GntP family gluconate:H+ symporter
MSDSFIVLSVIFSILIVILATAKYKINAFFSLITVSILLALFIQEPSETPVLLMNGFGSTLGSIGLIIIFGTSLGVLLEKSGATHGMANFVL